MNHKQIAVESMGENQVRLFVDGGVYFVSYGTKIVFRPWNGNIVLDKEKWNYSKTTSKYRSIFLLGETTKETERKIASGEYELADLN